MKSIAKLIRCFLPAYLVICCINAELHSQVEDVVELTLHARSVPQNSDAIRLLPREHELRDGNAVVELLRMPWEQHNFMVLERKMINDWLEMKGDAPELVKHEGVFEHFKNKMRRAAYTRDADWDYPIGEQPFVSILLPDVQGMRGFVGRIMSLWIRIQIKKGDLKKAEEGILIQMACARHVCSSPIIVCQLVGAAIISHGCVELEDLIQHPKAENFYYALGMLPTSFGDFKAAVDLEYAAVRQAMPSIEANQPPPGDERWKTAFDELYENYIVAFVGVVEGENELDRESLQRQADVAAKELPELTEFSEKQIASMSDKEKCVRWMLAHHENLSGRYIAAIQQPTHHAIQALTEIESDVDLLNERIFIRDQREVPEGAVAASFFNMYTVRPFIGCHRFGRTVKLLRIVEAIRHHASQNDNQLPMKLAEIDLPLPLDPFTNAPANYEVKEGYAMLSWPLIPNVGDNNNYRKSYKIKLMK